jgi:dipeptidyl aminopeptidase/acylaminoacyl peptidase
MLSSQQARSERTSAVERWRRQLAFSGHALSAVGLPDLIPTRREAGSPYPRGDDALNPRLLSDAVSAAPVISPDGTQLAFLADEGDGTQVFVSPTDLWAPRRFTGRHAPVVSASWSADGSLLGFATEAPGGGAQTRLHVVDAKGRSERPMFVAHGERSLPGTWSRTGRSYAFSTTLGCVGAGCSSYVLDLVESTLLPLVRATADEGRIDVDDLSPDGHFALLRVGRSTARRTVLLDRRNGRRRDIGSVAAGARFNRDGSRILFRSVRPDGKRVLATCRTDAQDDDSGEDTELNAGWSDDAGLEGLTLSGDRTTALLTWNRPDGGHRLEARATESERSLAVPLPLEPAIVLAATLDATGRRGIVELSAPELPPSLWNLDVATGRMSRLDAGPAPLAAMSPGTIQRFAGSDGTELVGRWWAPFRMPAADAAGPVVILLPNAPGEPDRLAYRPLVHALLDVGIAVFRLSARPGILPGPSPVPAADEELETALSDIADAARFLLAAGMAAPRDLGLYGAGYGGSLTLSAITRFPELFAAAADESGVANFETFVASADVAIGKLARDRFEDPWTESPLLRALSPLQGLDTTPVPTLVIHGGADTTVPLRESEQAIEALSRGPAPVEALILPDEGHTLTSRAAQRVIVPATVEWFLRHLPGPALPRLDDPSPDNPDGGAS